MLRLLCFTLAFLACSSAVLANSQAITLINGQKSIELSVAELRKSASLEFSLYDPYQAADVEMRGIPFRDFLIKHFGSVPSALHFTAWDDYAVSLSGWGDPDWVLVTHENDQPLTLRDRGPLRLVERDYADRDTENLREFNDWLWMIRSIEAQW